MLLSDQINYFAPNSFFFRGLIRIEVLELNRNVRYIARSVCKQFFSSWCALNIDSLTFDQIWSPDFNGLEWFVGLKFLRIQDHDFMSGVNDYIFVNFELGCSLLELGCLAGSIVVPTMRLFFRGFLWRSGMLEYWIRSYAKSHRVRSYVQSHWLFSPDWDRPFVVIDVTN